MDFRVGDEGTTADIMRDATARTTKKKRHITGMNTACPIVVSHSAKFIADRCSNDLNDPQILEMDSDSVTDISDSENITNNVQSPAVATQHLL